MEKEAWLVNLQRSERKLIFARPNRSEEAEKYFAMVQAGIGRELDRMNAELEEWLAESIALADYDHIDDIFIACLPDGTRAVQSWWNKPEWVD